MQLSLAILMTAVYALLFMPILRKVGVTNELGKRSLILGSAFAGIEFGFSLVGGASSAATVLTIFVFIFLLRFLLVLKPWQAIGIPILVAVVGTLTRFIFEPILSISVGILWLFGSIS